MQIILPKYFQFVFVVTHDMGLVGCFSFSRVVGYNESKLQIVWLKLVYRFLPSVSSKTVESKLLWSDATFEVVFEFTELPVEDLYFSWSYYSDMVICCI